MTDQLAPAALCSHTSCINIILTTSSSQPHTSPPYWTILTRHDPSGSLSAYQERAGTKLESRASAIFTIFLGPNWSHIDLNSALIKLQKFKWNKLWSQHRRKVMKESSILSCVETSKTWQETNNRVIFHQVLHHTQCHNSYLNLSIGRTAV